MMDNLLGFRKEFFGDDGELDEWDKRCLHILTPLSYCRVISHNYPLKDVVKLVNCAEISRFIVLRGGSMEELVLDVLDRSTVPYFCFAIEERFERLLRRQGLAMRRVGEVELGDKERGVFICTRHELSVWAWRKRSEEVVGR